MGATKQTLKHRKRTKQGSMTGHHSTTQQHSTTGHSTGEQGTKARAGSHSNTAQGREDREHTARHPRTHTAQSTAANNSTQQHTTKKGKGAGIQDRTQHRKAQDPRTTDGRCTAPHSAQQHQTEQRKTTQRTKTQSQAAQYAAKSSGRSRLAVQATKCGGSGLGLCCSRSHVFCWWRA